MIGGEPFKIVVANNGHKVLKAVTSVKFDIKPHSVAGLSSLTLSSADNADVKWGLKYE